jgi:Trypsin-like peptidase domain
MHSGGHPVGKYAAQLFLCACVSVFAVAQTSQTIDRLSVTSLAVTVFHGDTSIGSATGFVLQKNQNYYLVTNRHVVLTCAEDTNPNNVGGWICADKVKILHNTAGRLGDWFWVEESLYDENKHKRWLEHPTLGASADLIALPLKNTAGVEFYPLDLSLRNSDMQLAPGDPVNVVGFPFGESQGGGLPIWKTGTIASDLDINYGGKAKFLVDTTARSGMSGSPVYARRFGTYQDKAGTATVGNVTKFLGVYSEENQALELGAVWKAEAVAALYESLP